MSSWSRTTHAEVSYNYYTSIWLYSTYLLAFVAKRRTNITLQGNFLVTETFRGTYQQKPPAKPKRAFANRKSCSRDSSLNRADKHQTLIKQVNSENKRLSASTSDLSSIGIRKQYKPSKLPVYQRQGKNICR